MGKRNRDALVGWWHNAELQRLGLFVRFLPGILSITILVAAAVFVAAWPDDGIVWQSYSGRIESVDVASPAASILKRGDIIVSVDGIHLDQIVQLYAGKHPGDAIIFEVNRGVETRTVAVRLDAPSFSRVMSRLEPLFIGLAFWAIGTAVLAFKPAGKTEYVFSCFNQLGCIALSLGALSASGLLWARQLFSPSLWFLGSLTIHLHLHFPRRIAIPHRRLPILAVYAVAFVGSLLGLIQKSPWATLAPNLPYLEVTERLYLIASFSLSVALLLYSYRHTTSFKDRRQVRLIALGTAMALIPFSLFLLVPEALLGFPLVPYEFTFLFLLAIPLAYGYSICRYRLIQVDRTVSRGVVYVLLSILLAAMYLLLNVGASHFFHHEIWQEPWCNMLFFLALVVAFAPLRDRLQRVIDWIFYGGWYNYETAVQEISRALDGVMDSSTLATRLISEVQVTLKLECACLFLKDPDGNLSAQGYCPVLCPGSGNAPLRLASSDTLIQWFEREQHPVACSALPTKLMDLSAAEQVLLACTETRLWVPLAERGKLLGLLILGRKQGDDPFDGEDLRILEVVQRQVSITLQNIALLHDLSKRAAEMEQLHQQLLRSREQERKRLARELHDDIIQSLVGLNYDLSRIQTQQTWSDDGDDGGIERLQHQVHEVMRNLRKVCSELRPPALDSLGLVSAVRSRLRDFESEGELRVKLIVDGNEDTPLPEEASLCLYRVLQEALVNIQKHARARRVVVKLKICSAQISLSVQDDGCGFCVPSQLGQFMEEGHFGLVGARERLDLIRGKLILQSTPGRGTQLEARIQLRESQGVEP